MVTRAQAYGKYFPPYGIKYSYHMRSGGGWFKHLQTDRRGNSWSFSCWIKKSSTAAANVDMGILGEYSGTNNQEVYGWSVVTDQRVCYLNRPSTQQRARIQSNATIGTSAGWKHYFLRARSYVVTAGSSWYVDPRLWIDGVEQSNSFIQGSTTRQEINGPTNIRLGNCDISESGSYILRGYMADPVFYDGLELSVNLFGEIDPKSGLWVPRNVRETVDFASGGPNTFFLDWRDATSATTLGYDYSGKGNNFTPVGNVSPSDRSTDTPTA